MTSPAADVAGENGATAASEPGGYSAGTIVQVLRITALCTVALALLFIFNNYLIFWQGWPGVTNLYAHLGLFGLKPSRGRVSLAPETTEDQIGRFIDAWTAAHARFRARAA